MSDEMIIRHCSPTLAGLKTENIFSCPYSNKKELFCAVRSLNQRLVPSLEGIWGRKQCKKTF